MSIIERPSVSSHVLHACWTVLPDLSTSAHWTHLTDWAVLSELSHVLVRIADATQAINDSDAATRAAHVELCAAEVEAS